MALPNIMHTGKSGLMASRAAISTTGHNIANANTEGFSRQRVNTQVLEPAGQPYGKNRIGTGTTVSRVERVNDEYIEKQIRNGNRDMSHFEEKDLVLRQTEDIFNEMGGEGLNRLVSKFFNEFRKLANEPENEAVRQSVRESAQAMTHDIKRMRTDLVLVRDHIDSRIEGYAGEVNALGDQIRDLNSKIRVLIAQGGSPNDLEDARDLALKKLSAFMDISMHKDNHGDYIVDIRDVGPFVIGPNSEKLIVEKSPADDSGKADGALDIKSTATVTNSITHQLKGGRLGALVDARDRTLETAINRLDELAYGITEAVNQVHSQGFTIKGATGLNFFKPTNGYRERAAEFMDLSDEVKSHVNNIATAAVANAPGDNRIAIAITGLQGMKLMNEGTSTLDDWYNSIVSEVGVANAKNRSAMSHQKDINTQLDKMREQISGVSLDEETTNLLHHQHVFDASAKVIQIADDMMKTVLELKR